MQQQSSPIAVLGSCSNNASQPPHKLAIGDVWLVNCWQHIVRTLHTQGGIFLPELVKCDPTSVSPCPHWQCQERTLLEAFDNWAPHVITATSAPPSSNAKRSAGGGNGSNNEKTTKESFLTLLASIQNSIIFGGFFSLVNNRGDDEITEATVHQQSMETDDDDQPPPPASTTKHTFEMPQPWLLGHTHLVKEHEMFWHRPTPKPSPGELLKKMHPGGRYDEDGDSAQLGQHQQRSITHRSPSSIISVDITGEEGSNIAGECAVICFVKSNGESTKIDIVRAALNVLSMIGVKVVHFITRVQFNEKSKKSVKAKCAETGVSITFWSAEEELSYDWFNNTYMNPMAVVRKEESGRIETLLGTDYLLPCIDSLPGLVEGQISKRFDLRDGDLLHSQRFAPKLGRQLRAFRPGGSSLGAAPIDVTDAGATSMAQTMDV